MTDDKGKRIAELESIIDALETQFKKNSEHDAWKLDNAEREIERLNRECISTFLHEQRIFEVQETIKARDAEIGALKDTIEMLMKQRSEQRAMIDELEAVLSSIRDHSVNIEKNHANECAHGAGYSLLGQLAQQSSTEAGEALEKLAEFRKGKR